MACSWTPPRCRTAEAEYICNCTLDLSRELHEEGAWEGDGGLAGSLIEVEVKGRASYFNEASCGLGDW